MINKEFISVVVVTYNSENTIIETLNSVINQSYGAEYINLIISDDCSNDRTVLVINDWITKYKNSFNEVELLVNNLNKGVTANCNIAWKRVKTSWVKSIAGDDLLNPECIESFVAYIHENKNCAIVFSQMEWFGSITKIVPEKYDLPFFQMSAKEQYQYLMFKSFNLAPTSFMKMSALRAVDYADERFRNIEDLPLWLRFTKNGYKLHFNPTVTVKYRVGNSISKNKTRYINESFLNDLIDIDKMHGFRNISGFYYKLLKIDMLTLLYGKKTIKYLTKNKKGRLSYVLDHVLFVLRPVYVFIKLKKIMLNRC
ncbi:glycosyltransferase [Erwinia sp. D4-22]